MENRISVFEDELDRQDERREDPQPLGEILMELLTQYAIRFPEARFTIVETPVSAA